MTLCVGLLGLTGLGNGALRGILEAGHVVGKIWTRAENSSFPYFSEENLHAEAVRFGIQVLNSPFTMEYAARKVESVDLDVLLVSSYHLILPPAVLESISIPIFNFHPSLLPKFRGRSPMQNAIMAGETHTGLTVHRLVAEVDAGPITMQKWFPLEKDETMGTLFLKMQTLIRSTVPVVLKLVEDGNWDEREQVDAEATYCRPISSSPQLIDFNIPAPTVSRMIRATLPFPGSCINIRGVLRSVLAVRDSDRDLDHEHPGKIIQEDGDHIVVATTQGVIDIELGHPVHRLAPLFICDGKKVSKVP